MAKIFYDHLVVIEEVIVELDRRGLDATSRQELIHLIDETLHHHLLDTILTHLPQERHEVFLTRFHTAPHDPDLINFLKEETGKDMESIIRKKAKKVKKEILATIKK